MRQRLREARVVRWRSGKDIKCGCGHLMRVHSKSDGNCLAAGCICKLPER
jgi:hypothetical protein